MARILLADIPNAPGPGPAPVGAPNLQGVNLARPVDRTGAIRDTGSRRRAQALLSQADAQTRRGVQVRVAALESTKKDQINPAAFTAEGEGIARVGAAIGQAGAVTAGFAQNMFAAKDAVDMARVDTIMRSTLEQHQADIESGQIPETQWVEGWKQKIPQMQQQIEALNISPRVRAKVDADFIRFNSSASISIARAATSQSIEIGRNTILNAADKAFADGDFEVAEGHIQEGVTTGLLRRDEADRAILKMETTKRGEWVAQAMNADPAGFLAKMEDSRKTGNAPEDFHWLTPSDVDRNYRAAKSLVGQQQSDTFNGIAQSIDAGEITDPKQIDGMAQGLDSKQVKALKHSLLEVNGPDPEATAKLMTQVASYDPQKDKDRSQFNTIMHSLLTELPRNYSSDLRTQLYNRRMGYDKTGQALPVVDKVRSMVFGQIDDLFSSGQFGKFDNGKPGEKKVVDEAAKSAAWEKALTLKDAFQNYKPKDPNSQSEAYDWLKSQMRDENLGIGSQHLNSEEKKGPGFLSFFWNNVLHDSYTGAEEDAPPTPEDINKKLGEGK